MELPQLKKLYEDLLDRLKNSAPQDFGEIKPTNLFCISPSSSYLNSDVRVMVFGKETNDWEGEFDLSNDVDRLFEIYSNFFSTGYCYQYGGHFWNGVSKLKDRLEEEFSQVNKSVGLIWNNLVKIGRENEKGLPPKDILDWQSPAFEIVKSEVQICKPDIVVFFTGHGYDKFVVKSFEDASFGKVKGRPANELVKVASKCLPNRTVRTYHPNHLWRNDFYKYLDDIIKEVV